MSEKEELPLTQNIEIIPVRGKTYSLFGDEVTPDRYYSKIEQFADRLVNRHGDPQTLLSLIRRSDKKTFALKRSDGQIQNMIADAEREFSEFLMDFRAHRRSMTLRQWFDGTLRLPRTKYFLYMLEIELVNRIYQQQFCASEFKLGFLPHCLRDFRKQCKATSDEIDYLCQHCSKTCFIHHISELLEKFDIRPYIWMEANLRQLFRGYSKDGLSFGVLGIACIPELVNGMRLCNKFDIPVVGIPLNANRCARWMGQFYQNSVDLIKLEQLICN